MTHPPIPVFDGHNDMLLRLFTARGDPETLFRLGDGQGHIDLPRARQGGFAGGLFAVFPPSPGGIDVISAMAAAAYDLPLPPLLDIAEAQRTTFGMVALLLRLARAFPDDLSVCTSVAEIRAAVAAGRIAAVLHIEGAEAIDPDFVILDILHAAGLRSLGPVWSRQNIWGHGVPFRYPSDGDTGDGLTAEGRALVRACNARGILVDLSHLNARGILDVAEVSSAPLVASHSNVHALCPSARNLTGPQLAAIRGSRGLVGLNFATCFLRPDGAMRADTDLDLMVRHLDALIEALGEEGVGFGSDFDGAVVPAPIGDVAGLPVLLDRLRQAGYSEDLLRKLAFDNWLGVLERTWAGRTWAGRTWVERTWVERTWVERTGAPAEAETPSARREARVQDHAQA